MTSPPFPESPITHLRPWQTWPVRITAKCLEAPGVHTYDLQFCSNEDACRYVYRPGQFNMLYLPGVGEAAISIAGRVPETSILQHTVRTVGRVTETLNRLEVGQTLGLRGPFGSHWPLEELTATTAERPDVVVVAGGIGLAPLRAAILYLLDHAASLGNCTLLLGARSPADLIYQTELDHWRERGLDVQVTVDRPSPSWQGQVGVVTLLLERLPLARPDHTFVLTCGPEVMMRYVLQAAVSRGIPAHQFYVTLERNMQCAVGHCGHCQLGPEFICKDGPVFSYDRVASLLSTRDL